MSNSVLWLFLNDLFHQVLFYFGTIAAMLVLLWEKWKKRSIEWRWIAIFFLSCLFVSCFQAWKDEHNNSTTLISQKRDRDVQIGGLVAQQHDNERLLADKDGQITWLRNHQVIQLSSPPPDPALAKAMELNSKALEELSSREHHRGASLKAKTIELSNKMLQFLSAEDLKEREVFSSPPIFITSDPAERQRLWREWQLDIQRKYEVISNEVMTRYVREFHVDALALLQQIAADGEQTTEVKDSDIKQITGYCEIANNTLAVKDCATKLGVVGQTMR